MKAHVIDTPITWISRYRYPITKSSNWVSVIGHPRDHAVIALRIGARKTRYDREFCYKYDYNNNNENNNMYRAVSINIDLRLI